MTSDREEPRGKCEARLDELELAVAELRLRNERVDVAKRWETSRTRIVTLLLLTYSCMCILLTVIGVNDVFSNALVPTAGYLLSTLSLPIIKDWWSRLNGGR